MLVIHTAVILFINSFQIVCKKVTW